MGGFQNLCTALNAREDPLESYMLWYHEYFGLNFHIFYELHLEVHTELTAFRSVAYWFCTQYGSRLVTVANPFMNVYPNVLKDEYYEKWCTAVIGEA